MRAINRWISMVLLITGLALAQAVSAADNFTRQDVTFASVGKKLVGWLYVPNGMKQGEKRPTIVMAHGWSAVKEMYLDDFAAKFANGGLVVVVFDYRNFGGSEGEPRGHIDPHMQHEDYKNAITWTTLQPMVDGNRIGIWGSSYSGGHVLHLAAFDRRVKCAVAQVPLVNAMDNFRRLVRADHFPGTQAWLAADRMEEYTKGKINYLPVVAEQGKPSALPTQDSYDWFIKAGATRAPSWKNEQTVRSLELALEYSPAANIHLISPTPLMIVVAENDILTPTDLAIEAFGRAREPKQLVIIPGGHFDAYTGAGFQHASTPALNWFKQHLMK
ncbi:MAG: alpha/beta hydrolase [Burkholderiales bacterium]